MREVASGKKREEVAMLWMICGLNHPYFLYIPPLGKQINIWLLRSGADGVGESSSRNNYDEKWDSVQQDLGFNHSCLPAPTPSSAN